jgi:hypothetical protein
MAMLRNKFFSRKSTIEDEMCFSYFETEVRKDHLVFIDSD